MMRADGCPEDRSELLLLLEGRATHSLRAHIGDCDVCRTEVEELRGTFDLVTADTIPPPSDRVRRETISYARSQVRGAAGWGWWRAPAAAAAAVVAAMLSGTVAYARLGSADLEIGMPGPWTLVLAAIWGSALFLYASPVSKPGQGQLRSALIGAFAFLVLVLMFPIPMAVRLCAEWLGAGQLTQADLFWAFVLTASLYACSASAIASFLGDRHGSRSDKQVAAILFTFLAAPLLVIQAAPSPLIVIVGGILGLLCGASFGCRLR